MPRRKKKIQHDEIVARFGQRLRELRLGRGLSQAELARLAQVTTNYVSRLEGGGAAPGIDLVARICTALGVTISDLLPMAASPADDVTVMRENATRLFEGLIETDDAAVLLVLTQVLARLAEATNR